MTKINFELDVPQGKEGKFFATLAGLFGGGIQVEGETPITVKKGGKTPEKAVKQEPEVEKEKAAKTEVPTTVEKPEETETEEETTKEKPAYTLVALRAKAKEVAGKKGTDFIKDALTKVGSSSISNIEESKFADFMDILTGGDDE